MNGSSISILGNNITLKAGKTYKLTSNLHFDSTTAQNLVQHGWYNATTNTLLPNSQKSTIRPLTTPDASALTSVASAIISTVADTQVNIRIISLTSAIIISAESSFFYIEEILTPVNVVNTVDYLLATTIANQQINNNAFYIPNTILAGSVFINTSTGAITLQAGKTYELTAQIRIIGSTFQYLFYRWVDFTTKTPLSSTTVGENESLNGVISFNSNAPIVTCIYTPTTNQTIGLLYDTPTSGNFAEGTTSFVSIKQIGSTAVPKNGDGTIAGIDYRLLNNVEVATGDIWIDGKIIYRKRISYTPSIPAGAAVIVDAVLKTSTYVSELISVKGACRDVGNSILPLPYSNVDNATFSVGIFLSSSGLAVATGSSRVISNTTIIIEYTKI